MYHTVAKFAGLLPSHLLLLAAAPPIEGNIKPGLAQLACYLSEAEHLGRPAYPVGWFQPPCGACKHCSSRAMCRRQLQQGMQPLHWLCSRQGCDRSCAHALSLQQLCCRQLGCSPLSAAAAGLSALLRATNKTHSSVATCIHKQISLLEISVGIHSCASFVQHTDYCHPLPVSQDF